MTDDTVPNIPAPAPDLVADYLADLLRSMTSLAEAADLPRSVKALRHALVTVNEERLRENIACVERAASDR